MNKKVQFFIDDVIFVFRDLAKEQPKSLFDHPYMNMLKTAHDKYGMKVQLNCFYRLSFFYGMEDFDLSEMPDCTAVNLPQWNPELMGAPTTPEQDIATLDKLVKQEQDAGS